MCVSPVLKKVRGKLIIPLSRPRFAREARRVAKAIFFEEKNCISGPTSQFKKSYKKLPKIIQEKANEKDKIFQQNPSAANLRVHKLKGKLKNYWSYSVDENYRVLFGFIDRNKIIYFHIGTHEIYFRLSLR